MSWFLQGQRKTLFLNKQNISSFFFILQLGVSCAFIDKGDRI
nr:MAG TPA: hypothetical protein [Microviridae sp.]